MRSDGTSAVSAEPPSGRRVLLITNIFPPMIGGPATFIDRLGHELSHRGWRVTVVCSSECASDASDLARPVRVCRVPVANRYLYEIRVRMVLAREMLRHQRIFVNLLEEYVSQVNRIFRRRFVLKVVGDRVWETARNRGATDLDVDAFQTDAHQREIWADAIRERASWVRGAELVITPSQYLARIVCGWGVPAERVAVVPNGVDEEFFQARAESPRDGGCLHALFVGRLTNWKGVDTLLLALPRVPNVHVTVAGEGPEYAQLTGLATQLGLAHRVSFTGRLARSEVLAAMKRAHVLVLPSLYEGLSHTLLEAMAVGLPCIATGCGGDSEVLVHEQNGLLVPPLHPPSVAAALSRLERDENLRQALAEGARRT